MSRADGGDRADVSEAERIAAAVLAVPGIVSMSTGPVGQFRSYLPGGRTVPGVRIDAGQLEINVVTEFGPPLPVLSRRIGLAVAPLLNGRTLTVGIDDVLLPDDHIAHGADSIVTEPDH